jgi:hypothetical protein
MSTRKPSQQASSLDKAIGVGRRVKPEITTHKIPWSLAKELADMSRGILLGPASVNYPPPTDREPDAVIIIRTNQETAHLYR